MVEAFLRARRGTASVAGRRVAAGVLLGAAGFLVLGTYFFAVELWLPAIASRLTG